MQNHLQSLTVGTSVQMRYCPFCKITHHCICFEIPREGDQTTQMTHEKPFQYNLSLISPPAPFPCILLTAVESGPEDSYSPRKSQPCTPVERMSLRPPAHDPACRRVYPCSWEEAGEGPLTAASRAGAIWNNLWLWKEKSSYRYPVWCRKQRGMAAKNNQPQLPLITCPGTNRSNLWIWWYYCSSRTVASQYSCFRQFTVPHDHLYCTDRYFFFVIIININKWWPGSKNDFICHYLLWIDIH